MKKTDASETVEETVAATHEASPDTSPSPPQFRKVRRVTRRQHKWTPGEPLVCKIEKPFYDAKGDPKELLKPEDKRKKPPVLCNVIDLMTGEECVVIVGTVLKSEMEEFYPDNSYVDKCFEITQVKTPDKAYSLWNIIEVEPV